MKSFGIKRDENDPRWAKFIEWGNKSYNKDFEGTVNNFYGITKYGDFDNWNSKSYFDRIITLDEWEAEFVQPKLAGREYDERLLNEFINKWMNESQIPLGLYSIEYLNQRYAKQYRISEIKAEIEKLSIELKELEG